MPFIIPNPAVQGFQEGAQENMGNMRIAENMLATYLNNQAQQIRANDAQMHDAAMKQALYVMGYNPVTGKEEHSTTRLAGGTVPLEEIMQRQRAYIMGRPQPSWSPGPTIPKDDTLPHINDMGEWNRFMPVLSSTPVGARLADFGNLFDPAARILAEQNLGYNTNKPLFAK